MRQQTVHRLRDLDSRLASSSSIRLLREIIRLQVVLKSTDIGRVEKALQKLRQLYYNKGNKAHTLLARKLREQTHISAPQALRGSTGTLHYHPDCIAQLLRDYFSDLYNNPSIPHIPTPGSVTDHVRTYLTKSGLATLPAETVRAWGLTFWWGFQSLRNLLLGYRGVEAL